MNKLEVLIYKVQPYGETSRLLQGFSRLGKVSLVAKGSQKLNSDLRILSQYLTLISTEYTNFKSMLTIKNGKIINGFNDIKGDYNKIKKISVLLDIIGRVYIDSIYNEKVFNLLIESLTFNNLDLSISSFLMKLSFYLGYGLDLKGNGSKVIGLNLSKGGVVYENEQLVLDLDYKDTLNLLKITYSKISELEELSEKEIIRIKELLYKYYNNYMDINIQAFM